MPFIDAQNLFAEDARRSAIAERLQPYLMRTPEPYEINRYMEIEERVGSRGEAAVLAAWVREHYTQERLATTEIRAIGQRIDRRVERKQTRSIIPRRPRHKGDV